MPASCSPIVMGNKQLKFEIPAAAAVSGGQTLSHNQQHDVIYINGKMNQNGSADFNFNTRSSSAAPDASNKSPNGSVKQPTGNQKFESLGYEQHLTPAMRLTSEEHLTDRNIMTSFPVSSGNNNKQTNSFRNGAAVINNASISSNRPESSSFKPLGVPSAVITSSPKITQSHRKSPATVKSGAYPFLNSPTGSQNPLQLGTLVPPGTSSRVISNTNRLLSGVERSMGRSAAVSSPIKLTASRSGALQPKSLSKSSSKNTSAEGGAVGGGRSVCTKEDRGEDKLSDKKQYPYESSATPSDIKSEREKNLIILFYF